MIEDPWKSGINGEARFYLDLLTHDIKNLNQGVHGYLELMTLMPDTTEKQRKFLEEALSYVRLSSNLIHSIELDSMTRANDQSMELNRVIHDAKAYVEAINSNTELSIIVDDLPQERSVKGNLLLVDVFMFLLDYMLKRTERNGLRVNIKVKETLDGSVQIRIEGDFRPPDPTTILQLFSEKDPVSGNKRGKLLLCRSIVERFGGTINYFKPSTTTGLGGGGFLVELKEVIQ